MTPALTDGSVSPAVVEVELGVHGSVTLTGPGGVVARVLLVGFTRPGGTGSEAIVGVDADPSVPVFREELLLRPVAVADIRARAQRAADRARATTPPAQKPAE